MSYIHKSCIERWHDFLHTTVVDITYGKGINPSFFAIDLHKSVVLSKRNSNLLWGNIHNQFAFHMSIKFSRDSLAPLLKKMLRGNLFAPK